MIAYNLCFTTLLSKDNQAETKNKIGLNNLHATPNGEYFVKSRVKKAFCQRS